MASHGLPIPPPNEATDFEHLCLELFKRSWNDSQAQLYGVKGQNQSGIDIVGRPNSGLEVHAVQCKVRSKRLAFSEVLSDIARADQMQPRLSHLVFATTARRDASLQSQVLALTLERSAQGKYPISIMAWDDLTALLAMHIDIARLHFPIYFDNVRTEGDGLVNVNVRAANSQRSERLRMLVSKLNGNHSDCLTVSEIAELLGIEKITELDDYFSGADEPSIELLKKIGDLFCINAEWIVHGKGSPFYHSEPFFPEAYQALPLIRSSTPEEVIFVRCGSEQGECVIVLKYNDWKFHRLNTYCHVSAHVGGTGSAQLLSLYNLIRELSKPHSNMYCVGETLNPREFDELLNGEVAPGSVLGKRGSRMPWWDALLDIEYKHATATHYLDLYGAALVDAHRVIREQIVKTTK
ncbi:restriction endonuclease [Rugamonas aquatica]|nr:restriction endonuclease [Rugamonas aquatica]